MDFTLDETQEELRRLAAELLGREATPDRLTAHERSGEAYDAATWRALAKAGLLAAPLPAEAGGEGLGAVELAVLLREVGAHVAPVPALATLALYGLPVAAAGTPAQREALAPLASGDEIGTGAVREPGGTDSATPRTTARPDGDGHVLDGVKVAVPYAEQATRILVPAQVPGAGVGVFAVPASSPGLTITPHPTGTNAPAGRVVLDGVRAGPETLVGGAADGSAAATLRRHALAGLTATASGVLAGALKLTTEHVRTREQFGRPLAAFQAVTMQIGDVYVAGRALDVAMWAGNWRLAERRAEIDDLLAAAAHCVTGPMLDSLYTCQHLHGGLGLDVTYPLQRYFAWGKYLSQQVGGEEAALDAAGELAVLNAAGSAAIGEEA